MGQVEDFTDPLTRSESRHLALIQILTVSFMGRG